MNGARSIRAQVKIYQIVLHLLQMKVPSRGSFLEVFNSQVPPLMLHQIKVVVLEDVSVLEQSSNQEVSS
jgi:hypothetical protein